MVVHEVLHESDARYEGWRVAFASAVSWFLASSLIYTFAVFFKPLAAEFSWSREVVASAYGLMAITSAISAPLFGFALDRSGVRRVIVPCMAIVGIAFGSLALLTARQWQFYATFALLGIVGTGLSPVGYSRAVSTWFDRRRGMALGLVISGAAVAGIVQPPAAQGLIDAVGWRTAYVIVGLTLLVIGVPVVSSLIRERPGDHAPVHARRPGADVAKALRGRTFWTIVVVFFAGSVALNGAIVHLAALLTDRGVAATSAALAISTMGAASFAGRLTTGWFLDRFSGARVSFVLLSIAALGTYLLASADSFPSGAFAAALIGLGMGGELDVTPYLLSRYYGLRSFSTLYGLAYGSSSLAGAIGPILLARTFDATGSYDTLLPKIAVFMFAVATLMLTLPPYDLRTGAQNVGPLSEPTTPPVPQE
jgi:MFS family permease